MAVRAVCRKSAEDLVLGQRLKMDGVLELRRESSLPNDPGRIVVADACLRAVV